MIEHYDSVDVFVGVDVGKGEHHPPSPQAIGTHGISGTTSVVMSELVDVKVTCRAI